jgi:hypothetical protein
MEPAEVGRRPELVDNNRHTVGMNRIPMAMAGLALVAVTAVGCGEDKSGTASDPVTSGTTTAPSASETPTSMGSSPTGSPTDNGDPVPSPVINRAVKDAIHDDFPALVPAGVPDGWTVATASYKRAGGGIWQFMVTDPDGNDINLRQSTDSLAVQLADLPDVKPAGTVDLSDYGTGTWKSFTNPGIAVLAKKLANTTVVVVGPVPDSVKELAQQLLTAEDAASGDGG